MVVKKSTAALGFEKDYAQWSVDEMIEFLDNVAFSKMLSPPFPLESEFLCFYGFNMSSTPRDEWPARLRDKVAKELSRAVRLPNTKK